MKKWILIIVFLLALCSGCKTISKVQREVVTEIVERHDTIRDVTVQIIRDSIYLHDSIVVTQDIEGNVIYKEKYIYRDLWHDAEIQVVHDSIIVYKDISESESETEKESDKCNFKDCVYSSIVFIAIGLLIGIFLILYLKKLS